MRNAPYVVQARFFLSADATRSLRSSLRLTRVEGVAPALCGFVKALPLCDLTQTPASSAASPHLPGCPGDAAAASACRVDGAVPPLPADAARVSRRSATGPGGFTLPLVGSQGVLRNSSGRVYYGDTLDVIVPFQGDHVALLAATSDAFPAAFLPSLAAAAAALAPTSTPMYASLADKVQFAAFMAAHGDTFGAAAPRTLSEPPGKGDYPCVLKAAVSSGGMGVHVLRGPRDYAKAVAVVGADAPRVLQAYAPGQRQGTAHYALLRGRPLASVFFEAPRPRGRYAIVRGSITGYVRRDTSPHAPLFEQLFAALNFSGLACVNYITQDAQKGAPERVTVLEVNPRVGSSLREAPHDMRRLVMAALDAMEEEAKPMRRMPTTQ